MRYLKYKKNLKIPLKTYGFNLSFQEVNKNLKMKPQNTKSYPTNGTLNIANCSKTSDCVNCADLEL